MPSPGDHRYEASFLIPASIWASQAAERSRQEGGGKLAVIVQIWRGCSFACRAESGPRFPASRGGCHHLESTSPRSLRATDLAESPFFSSPRDQLSTLRRLAQGPLTCSKAEAGTSQKKLSRGKDDSSRHDYSENCSESTESRPRSWARFWMAARRRHLRNPERTRWAIR